MNSVLELASLIQGFKLSCQTEGKSPKTIEWYTSFLDRFLQFLKLNSLPTSINQIDKNHIREFIRYLQTQARTPRCGKLFSAACSSQSYSSVLGSTFSNLDKI